MTAPRRQVTVWWVTADSTKKVGDCLVADGMAAPRRWATVQWVMADSTKKAGDCLVGDS